MITATERRRLAERIALHARLLNQTASILAIGDPEPAAERILRGNIKTSVKCILELEIALSRIPEQ